MRNLLLAAFLVLPIAVQAAPCEGVPGEAQVTVQLTFGRAHRDGRQIDAAEWADYLAREVSARFPGRLTVIDATAQWQHPATKRVMGEKNSLVEIIITPSPDTWERMQALREAYKKRFKQDSVGMVTTLSCASS